MICYDYYTLKRDASQAHFVNNVKTFFGFAYPKTKAADYVLKTLNNRRVSNHPHSISNFMAH